MTLLKNLFWRSEVKMAEEASGNKPEPENQPDRRQPVSAPERGKTQEPKIIAIEPKIIPLKARDVKESEDIRADRERLSRLLESEER